MKKFRSLQDIRYKPLEAGSGINSLTKIISGNDMVVVFSARKGTISFNAQVENGAARLMRQFAENNFIIVYPEQTQVDIMQVGMQTQDMKLSPIQEQIDNLNKLGKAVKKIFKSGNTKPEEKDENSNG